MEVQIWYQPSCITDLSSLSENSGTFSVGVPQFEITSLSGTSNKRLSILGNKYSLPELVAFLKSIVKYFSCFSVILPLFLRFLNNLLLVSARFCKIFSLKLTSL